MEGHRGGGREFVVEAQRADGLAHLVLGDDRPGPGEHGRAAVEGDGDAG
ncbi:MAG: hypothetical protein IPN17_17750 [Deltaproteobacteria bacterium]|nr:hypothetical protein [Deltaproteobacteria bacterium]